MRALFLVLAWLLLAVEVLELVDADTALWPQRSVAAAGIVAAVGLTVGVRRTGRTPVWFDLGAFATVVATAWGMGRAGAAIVLLLALGPMRALYGSRGSVAVGVGALVAGFGTAEVLLDGPAELLELGYLIVVAGLSGFALVIRHVGEAVAHHDVGSWWDRVLGTAAHRLLEASSVDEIDACFDSAIDEIDGGARAAWSDLLDLPDVRALDPAGPVAGSGLDAELHDRMRRLWTDARLARSLLSSEERYRRLAQGSRDGIYLRSATSATAFSYANPMARALFGQSGSDEEAGLDLGVVHPDDRGWLVSQLVDAPFIESSVRVRLRDPDRSGEYLWVEFAEAPVESSGGEVRTVQGTVRDVTVDQEGDLAREEALRQEREAADRLRALDEMRVAFLTAVGHELRTPVTGLLGAAKTLARRHRQLTTRQAEELAQVVDAQAGRLEILLGDLVELDRLERGHVALRPEPVRMLALATDVAAAVGDGADRVCVEGEAEVVVEVDRRQVERALRHLVDNALKHSPSPSRVRVTVTERGDGCLLTVEDDGPGVPPDVRHSLYDPFVQGRTAMASASPGTGIGLALVKSVAELHGGSVWVDRPADGGARFNLVLTGQVGSRV